MKKKSNFKNSKLLIRPVPSSIENLAFSQYVKSNIAYLDEKSILKL
jgi:hypothetical protein